MSISSDVHLEGEVAPGLRHIAEVHGAAGVAVGGGAGDSGRPVTRRQLETPLLARGEDDVGGLEAEVRAADETRLQRRGHAAAIVASGRSDLPGGQEVPGAVEERND